MDTNGPAQSYIPQRLLVSGLTRPEWEVLRVKLTQAIADPNCTVGLEGPAKHGPAFEVWLDSLIDNGGIGEMFWGYGQRHINIVEDRVIIRGVLRLQVMEMAGFLRQMSARKVAEDVQRMVISNQYAILNSDMYAARKRALDEWLQRRQVLGPQATSNGGMTPHAHWATTTTTTPPVEPAVMGDKGAIFPPPPPQRPLPHQENQQPPSDRMPPPSAPFEDSMFLPEPPTKDPATLPPPNQLAFDTCLSTAPTKYRFIFSADTPTLSSFLYRAHAKWGLAPGQAIRSLMVNVDGMIFELDLDDERDWEAFLALARKSHNPVAVLIGI